MARPVLLHPRVWNPGGQRRALVLHGLASDGATTFRMAEHLAARGFRVNAPDLRGHGLSPPTSDYGFAAYVADVAAIAEGLDLLVGHSWGGAVTAALAGQPGVTRAAVLLDPVLHLDVDAAQRLADDLAAEVAPRSLEAFAADVPHWNAEDVFRAWRAAQATSPHVQRRSILDALAQDGGGFDLRPAVGTWTVPTQVVLADPAEDALCRREHLALAGPSVEVTVADGAGHSVQREAVPQVLAALDRAVDALARS